ncbi:MULTISPECIES: hypothetical protein [unclassified Mesotoga]|uniref:hypothetical protein n=1 Tax=unclassified Mesotoga TaxID=1184398 RepID=UPI000DA65569|nr:MULTISPECIES: hypothetical protein [unclassified Mesotoga]PZC52190.1 hypothetical protein LH53_06205 [Mesotoga sp. TolDC]
MKRLLLMLLVVLCAASLMAQLGLRTLTPEPTETADATEAEVDAPDSEGLATLTLRTVDSLLVSFREGWKAPDDSTWKIEVIGSSEIMIPEDFSIFQEKTGLNYDVQIFDKDGVLFGRLFFYELESYARDELLQAVVTSLYGENASTEKRYEEIAELDNGLVVYLASLKVNPVVDYPFVIVYYPDEEVDITEAGPVAMFVFEPTSYSDGELERAKEIIAGIVGSHISIEEEPEEDEVVDFLTPEEGQHTDPFIVMVDSLLSEEEVEIFVDDWIEVEGDYFGFMMPPEFSVQFYLSDYFEVADLGLEGTIVGKLFVGEATDILSTDDVLDGYVYQYLGGFGDYEIIDSYSGYVDRESTISIFALDFSGQLCWLALFSESTDAEVFGPGEYFALVALADSEDAFTWAEWYTGILATLDF